MTLSRASRVADHQGDSQAAQTAGEILTEMTKPVMLMQAAIVYGAIAGGRYGAIALLAFTIDLKALYEFFRDRPQENAPLGMKT